MISLPLMIMSLAARAKEIKETLVQEGTGLEEQAMPPIMAWERKGVEVAAALAPEADRDTGMILAQAGVVGFAADALVFGVDAFGARGGINPVTEWRWQEGDMQRIAVEHPERAKQMLREELLFMRIGRNAKRVLMGRLPYRVTGHSIEWLPTGTDVDREMDGLVPNALKQSFALETAVDLALAQIGPPDDGTDPQTLADRATVTELRRRGATLVTGEHVLD